MERKKSIGISILIISIAILVGITIGFSLDQSDDDNTFQNYGLYQLLESKYSVEDAFPELSFNAPVGLYSPDDGTDRLFILEQTGKIYVFNNSRLISQKTLFLDLSSNITYGGERGLLGLAFHPNYSINGKFYINYINTSEYTVIAQYTVNNTNINKANASSGSIILTQYQPAPNHNGGQLAFGADGYLYASFGDGGSDSQEAQDRTNILGTIIRIDVDSGVSYSIPSDNPFYGNTEGFREEIWAYGFRNPWRFSFDSDGVLWVGDVGQNSYEEIDIVTNGSNYGWDVMEGNHCYGGGSCDQTNLTLPIYEYTHLLGTAITGGFVYNGTRLVGLQGKYIYGDYGSGKIWALSYHPTEGTKNQLLLDAPLQISSFGIDNANELYICDTNSGKIYKLVEK
jgi:glucose/arabinose dehydrogenase